MVQSDYNVVLNALCKIEKTDMSKAKKFFVNELHVTPGKAKCVLRRWAKMCNPKIRDEKQCLAGENLPGIIFVQKLTKNGFHISLVGCFTVLVLIITFVKIKTSQKANLSV